MIACLQGVAGDAPVSNIGLWMRFMRIRLVMLLTTFLRSSLSF